MYYYINTKLIYVFIRVELRVGNSAVGSRPLSLPLYVPQVGEAASQSAFESPSCWCAGNTAPVTSGASGPRCPGMSHEYSNLRFLVTL